ncbi:DUF3160 domain-containing protein [Anoxynatronum sibiricum]|uniref:DUF3160 domain-containing protein n=1 Tax=Anoxynatronum sibiricum TaxID=210623 RepID=A0ABU9VV50_9CLOT
MKKSVLSLIAGILCLALLFSTLTACGRNPDPGEDNPPPPEESTAPGDEASPPAPVSPPLAVAASFASYQEVPTAYTPQVPAYTVAPDLSNITNLSDFEFSPAAMRLLAENGFVVVPNDYYQEFFVVYETNLYEPLPSFITTDSMLHNYHLFFSHLLRVTEREHLVPELKALTTAMMTATESQAAALEGTDWHNAALRNLAFLAVAGRLLDPAMPVPEAVQPVVAEELALIAAHEGITISPMMNLGQQQSELDALQEDYSQYIPRGHYATDDALKSYFQTMMWYGRMTFRLKNEDETRSALLLTLALSEEDKLTRWDRIYQPTSFFVGDSDDPNVIQFQELMYRIYGNQVTAAQLPGDAAKWEAFRKEAAQLQPPQINSIPIFDESLHPDREAEITGFRFMGQRFTLDAAVFQRLIYREVGENSQGQRRMLPKALDIPAALGSQEAYQLLEAAGETDYDGYVENMTKLQTHFDNVPPQFWSGTLYQGWLYTLDALLTTPGEGYPSFMQNQAWTRKNLNTFLASWTELKHDTVLYAKQVYAQMGGGMENEDDRGYVEPNPELYARLASLVSMTREGLDQRGLLSQQDEESLERLETLALSLKTMSEKLLENQLLTDEEYDLIRSYGGQLEHFWLEALRDEGVDHRSALSENPAALVTDVATDPGGQVLTEATGTIFEIYVVVPVDGNLRVARGGVFSHYEFPWPLNDRLTNEKWRHMVETGDTPPLAPWTESYVAP